MSEPLSPALLEAQKTLNKLISQGLEYPDAHFKACSLHLVDAQALQLLYDAQFSASHDAYEARVQQYENEGMSRSDARAAAEADQLCGRL